MTKYMLLILGDEAEWSAMTPEQWQAHDEAHHAFREAAGDRVLGGQQLEPPAVATTLRSGPDGGLVMTDGPFLETKEGVGGFYLLEADHLDEVTKLVALLPEVRAGHSGVEIRPVVDHG
ncbi:YciI family protein [Asanoa sp. WMMD1127]|uniref:YciI family protein n=1 Tax=Asanoa sp. WMMD1127 TaxID=3016107 RepID=UPI0024168674|nr:YciI family protein [Asanoa sp. WMMD1127]MDG4826614.1 YciI family protein [Asanoa sp. WMMD1127]